jgi:hypothetical protein
MCILRQQGNNTLLLDYANVTLRQQTNSTRSLNINYHLLNIAAGNQKSPPSFELHFKKYDFVYLFHNSQS